MAKKEKKAPAISGIAGGKLESVIKDIKKRYAMPDRDGGMNASPIITADECPELVRIPTGILGIDFVTAGGFPAKRVVEVYGKPSSSKTTSILLTIAHAQKRLCGFCYAYACDCKVRGKIKTVWIDTEGTFDKNWAVALGVCLEDVFLVRAGYGEADIDIATAMLDTGEVSILVVDSIAMMCPSEELEKSTEAWQQGLHARLMNKAFRKWGSALNKVGGPAEAVGCCVILVNQIRYNIGSYGGGEVVPGGEGQKYAAAAMLKFKRPYKKAKETPETAAMNPTGTGLVMREQFHVKADKSKIGPRNGVGMYQLWTQNDEGRVKGALEEDKLTIDIAERYGVIGNEKVGRKNQWVWAIRDGPDRIVAESRPKLVKALQETPVPGSEDLQGSVTMWDQLRFDTISVMVREDVCPRLIHKSK